MDNLQLRDTMIVYAKDLATSDVYLFGVTSKAEWSQKIKTDVIRGGIGNYVQGVLASDKEMEFSVDPVFFNESVLIMNSGVGFSNGTATVKTFENNLKVSGGKVTLAGTPKGSSVDIFDQFGKKYAGTYATGQVTITSPPADGSYVTAVYDKDVTGNILTLSADKMPKNFELWAYTIGYDPNTNAVKADIWLHLNKAMPTGEFSVGLEAKNNVTPIKFIAQCPIGSTSFGEYISVPRS